MAKKAEKVEEVVDTPEVEATEELASQNEGRSGVTEAPEAEVAEESFDETRDKKEELASSEAEKKAPKKKAVKAASEGSKELSVKKNPHGKKYRNVVELIEKGKDYDLDEVIELLKKTATTKFDSSVEIHVNLNIDPANADHQIRGSVSMPAGLGKEKKVCAVVNADKEKEAKDAGAEIVGGQDVIEKIEKGFIDFDVVVATPDMMGSLGKIGKILGTKGLMPNPKTGTVTPEPGKVISEIKKGKADYRIDKSGNLHANLGKVSFKSEDLKANIEAFMGAIHHAKPASLKGTFIKSVFLTTTMGPSVKIVK